MAVACLNSMSDRESKMIDRSLTNKFLMPKLMTLLFRVREKTQREARSKLLDPKID